MNEKLIKSSITFIGVSKTLGDKELGTSQRQLHVKSPLLCDVAASSVRAKVEEDLTRSTYHGGITSVILVLINIMHYLVKKSYFKSL